MNCRTEIHPCLLKMFEREEADMACSCTNNAKLPAGYTQAFRFLTSSRIGGECTAMWLRRCPGCDGDQPMASYTILPPTMVISTGIAL